MASESEERENVSDVSKDLNEGLENRKPRDNNDDEDGEEIVNVLETGEDTAVALAASDQANNNNNNDDDPQIEKSDKKTIEKIVLDKNGKPKRRKRPARSQVDPSQLKEKQAPQQTGTVYNIWYNKWSGGDREDKYGGQIHADGRCNIAKDAGYTRADKIPGSYFCLFFARGLCPHGKDCNYLHRLPKITDIFNPNVDCFGRDKKSDYRDDMGGVGSFLRQNRTIYVGRIFASDDIEEIVARHFAEWGDIERIRVLNTRGVGFITYVNEANAQFAKEAMAHQSLDHSEILNVRWATIDPNPLAKAREQRHLEEQAAEAVRRLVPLEFLEELESRSLVKKRKT
ncbi:hypothetical protein V1514DRAFT_292411 [Lipomyces japonicus]|uniref:uncharacterized protein n=1 Tax=Lipomyces japonicus TaxID=56871 RepID=UPI0034CDFA56